MIVNAGRRKRCSIIACLTGITTSERIFGAVGGKGGSVSARKSGKVTPLLWGIVWIALADRAYVFPDMTQERATFRNA